MRIKNYVFCLLAMLALLLTSCNDGDDNPVDCNDCDVDTPVVCESDDCDDDTPPVDCEGDGCDDDTPVVCENDDCDDDSPVVCEGADCDDDPPVDCEDDDCDDDASVIECEGEVYTEPFYVFYAERRECGYFLFYDTGSAGHYHGWFYWVEDLPEEYREDFFRVIVTHCGVKRRCGENPVLDVVNITENNLSPCELYDELC